MTVCVRFQPHCVYVDILDNDDGELECAHNLSVIADVTRPPGTAASTSVPASETEGHPTASELEDGKGP